MTFSLSEILRLLFPPDCPIHQQLIEEAEHLETLEAFDEAVKGSPNEVGIKQDEYIDLDDAQWAICDHRMRWHTPNGWAPIYNPQALTFRTYAQAHDFAESGLVAQFPTAKPWPVRMLSLGEEVPR